MERSGATTVEPESGDWYYNIHLADRCLLRVLLKIPQGTGLPKENNTCNYNKLIREIEHSGNELVHASCDNLTEHITLDTPILADPLDPEEKSAWSTWCRSSGGCSWVNLCLPTRSLFLSSNQNLQVGQSALRETTSISLFMV